MCKLPPADNSKEGELPSLVKEGTRREPDRAKHKEMPRRRKQMQRYLQSRRGGVVGQTSDKRWWNQLPRLRRFGSFASFYYWRSHPSLTKEESCAFLMISPA